MACFSCNRRKQKCDGHNPCSRCIKTGKACLYPATYTQSKTANNQMERVSDSLDYMRETISFLLKKVSTLEDRLDKVNKAVELIKEDGEVVEHAANSQEENPQENGYYSMSSGDTGPSQALCPSPKSTRDDWREGRETQRHMEVSSISLTQPPLSAVQNIKTSTDSQYHTATSGSVLASNPLPHIMQLSADATWSFDPIKLGILTIEEAQELVESYFRVYHPMAPLLTVSMFGDIHAVRGQSSLLFLSILSVSARYYKYETTGSLRPHRRYADISALQNYCLCQLILHGHDQCQDDLETVESLLLYIQWKPFNIQEKSAKFHDASIWNIIGFAIRYSKFLCLEQSVHEAFKEGGSPTQQDFRKLRILLNLVSIDYHFMLSSRLPASFDPSSLATIARRNMSHPYMEPYDIKLLGLIDLATVLKVSSQMSGTLGSLDWPSLVVLNEMLDDWVESWRTAREQEETAFRRTGWDKMPFPAQRWYRLALNILPVQRLLTPETDWSEQEIKECGVCLRYCTEAAVEMLSSFLVDNSGNPLEGRRLCSEKVDPSLLSINSDALSAFVYSIDLHWVTHAFAFIYLCAMYSRGVLDENCTVCYSAIRIPLLDVRNSPLGEKNTLYKVLEAGCQLFSQIKNFSWHPAGSFASVVLDLFESTTRSGISPEFELEKISALPLDTMLDWDSWIGDSNRTT